MRLPTYLGGPGRDRTDDIYLARVALSQLSYRPKNLAVMVGFEPTGLLYGILLLSREVQ